MKKEYNRRIFEQAIKTSKTNDVLVMDLDTDYLIGEMTRKEIGKLAVKKLLEDGKLLVRIFYQIAEGKYLYEFKDVAPALVTKLRQSSIKKEKSLNASFNKISLEPVETPLIDRYKALFHKHCPWAAGMSPPDLQRHVLKTFFANGASIQALRAYSGTSYQTLAKLGQSSVIRSKGQHKKAHPKP